MQDLGSEALISKIAKGSITYSHVNPEVPVRRISFGGRSGISVSSETFSSGANSWEDCAASSDLPEACDCEKLVFEQF
jgi:hypothetical protein